MPERKEQPLRKVYPVGYGADGALQYVDRLMMQPQMLLIDIRFRPRSWRAEWREAALREKYGKRYRTAGPYLGNVNFQANPITLADPDEGLRGLRMYLAEGYDLILLCQCPDYHACHRKVVVDLLIERTSVEIIQPELAGTETETMMCLTVRQPYAQWLSNPGRFLNAGILPKTIENRDWTTKYRGLLLIHAGATFEHDAIDYWISKCPELEQVIPLDERAYAKGALVGIAELVDVIHQSTDPWFIGPYGFVLANARPLEPIPCRGQLKLFSVPIALLRAQLSATGMVMGESQNGRARERGC